MTEVRAQFQGPGPQSRWQSTQRFRPTLTWEPAEQWSLLITPQLMLQQGQDPYVELHHALKESLGDSYSLWSELCDWPYTEERVFRLEESLTLERLSLQHSSNRWGVRLGKQALNWGSSRFIQPSDVRPENRMAEPWLERRGHWSARVDLSLGDSDDAVLAVLESDGEAIGALRWSHRWPEADVALSSVHRAEDSKLSIDTKGDLGLLSLWLESSQRIAHGSQPTWWRGLQLSTGLDTSMMVLDGWLIGAQLSYDGSGESDPQYYDWMSRWPEKLWPTPCDEAPFPAQPEPRQTLGRWYAMTFTELGITPDLRFRAAGILNLSDHSSLWFPSLEWWVNDALSWSSGARFSAGVGEFSPQTMTGQPQLPRWTALSWIQWRQS